MARMRLAELLAMDRTTLAHNLKPLSNLDLVTIDTSTEDRLRYRLVGEILLLALLHRWSRWPGLPARILVGSSLS